MVGRGGPMPYWLIKTGEGEPGIDGGLHPRMGSLIPDAPVIAYVCTMMVSESMTAGYSLLLAAGFTTGSSARAAQSSNEPSYSLAS